MGGNQETGFALCEPLTDLRQHRLAVSRAKVCGQVKKAGDAAKQLGQPPGVTLEVDDAESGTGVFQIVGERLPGGWRIDVPEHLHPAGAIEQMEIVRHDLLGSPAFGGELADFGVKMIEGRLSGGREDHGGAVALGQPGQGGQGGDGEILRQGLNLVEEDDAARQPVELAAGGRAVGEEGFEDLHAGGDDERGVPVFGVPAGDAAGLLDGVRLTLPFALFVVRSGETVMLQDIALREARLEKVAIDPHRLLDDAEVGDGDHHPAQSMDAGVAQGEGEHRQRLAGAGGGGEREQSGVESAAARQAAARSARRALT